MGDRKTIQKRLVRARQRFDRPGSEQDEKSLAEAAEYFRLDPKNPIGRERLGELKPAGMPQHVGMHEEREFRRHARPGNHALISGYGQRRVERFCLAASMRRSISRSVR